MQSSPLQSPPKSSSQPEGEHIKKDKGKMVMSLEEAEKESTNSGSNDNDETHVTGSMVESSTTKKLKKEVVEACPNKTRKGWKTIYDQIKSIMDYLQTTEAELGINLDIPLSKQDPLDKLNDLTNKKRKHADGIHDYFKANKRLKSSVQYKDHLVSTVLNEPVLGMIIRHQGPGLDDHARTFSSLLLAKIDERNLNPLKQMRTIEQLRQ
ncbi:hypothetical protein Tco_1359240 [Tanacetum coccineum]